MLIIRWSSPPNTELLHLASLAFPNSMRFSCQDLASIAQISVRLCQFCGLSPYANRPPPPLLPPTSASSSCELLYDYLRVHCGGWNALAGSSFPSWCTAATWTTVQRGISFRSLSLSQKPLWLTARERCFTTPCTYSLTVIRTSGYSSTL